MNLKLVLIAAFASTVALACSKNQESAPGTQSEQAPAAEANKAPEGDVSCEAVVAKLASYDSQAGEPEKKLWTKLCEAMPPKMKSCIVASKTPEERDKCTKEDKP